MGQMKQKWHFSGGKFNKKSTTTMSKHHPNGKVWWWEDHGLGFVKESGTPEEKLPSLTTSYYFSPKL